MIIHLIVELIKKTSHKMRQYFLKPCEPFGGDVNVKVNISICATKTDFKKATGIDAFSLALKSN